MKNLIHDIESYCAAADIRPSTFGTYAVNDGKILARLKAQTSRGIGGQCLPSTEARIRDFMTENPPETLRKRARRRGRVAA